MNEALPEMLPTAVDDATPSDIAWQQRANDALDDSLGSIRRAATAWAATIAGLSGALGVAGLVTDTEELGAIGGWLGTVAYLAIVGAAATAALSIWQAAIASQGKPVTVASSGDAFREAYRLEATAAAAALERSRRLALASFVVALVAVSIVFFAPAPDTPARSYALLVMTDGSVACGELRTAGSELTLVAPKDRTIDLASGDAASISLVGECP